MSDLEVLELAYSLLAICKQKNKRKAFKSMLTRRPLKTRRMILNLVRIGTLLLTALTVVGLSRQAHARAHDAKPTARASLPRLLRPASRPSQVRVAGPMDLSGLFPSPQPKRRSLVSRSSMMRTARTLMMVIGGFGLTGPLVACGGNPGSDNRPAPVTQPGAPQISPDLHAAWGKVGSANRFMNDFRLRHQQLAKPRDPDALALYQRVDSLIRQGNAELPQHVAEG